MIYLHIKMTKLLCYLALGVSFGAAQVKITAGDDRIHVTINGQPYADFVVKSDDAMKPYLYPLRSADGTIVTRHWPMEKVSAIEPVDHQHQRGVWFGPDIVNGFDFWNNERSYPKPETKGYIKLDKIGAVKSGKKEGSIAAAFDWIDGKGTKIPPSVGRDR